MVVISGITVLASLFFIHNSLEQTVENSITVVCEVADALVTAEINLLISKTSAAAHNIQNGLEEEWPQIMREQLADESVFMALTVFDRNGVVLSYGSAPTPAELADSEFMRKAFAGEQVISTSRNDPSGKLVFDVCVPMEDLDMVLSATISGLHFSNLLAPYKIWDTGAIYLLDNEGVVIAFKRTSLVRERFNAFEDEKTNSRLSSLADFFRLIYQSPSGKGVGRYFLFGMERLCAFTFVSGSNMGWILGVSAPLKENPGANIEKVLLLTVLAFLGLGGAVAFFASGFVAKQFNIINEQNRHLADLSVQAQSVSTAKSRFLANMSHEMRTPLNAVIGFSELMLNGRTKREEIRGSLEKIHTAGTALLNIVNDILDISKIESGKIELIATEYDIVSLIEETVVMNLVGIEEKPIDFGLRIDETLPRRLIGDELRVRQICNNLLSNAFKYTKEGRVDMHISSDSDCDGIWLTISVQDTGVGIRSEDMPKLFLDYNQLDARSNRKIKGTGLGLSIAAKTAELMDGVITVESEYGKGSTFTARVRQQCATNEILGRRVAKNLSALQCSDKKAANSAKTENLRLPYARVLVVDDVPANLDVAQGILKAYGMQVDCVSSGQQAIELVRAQQTRYSAIFMDHMMPDMDGIEAARVIREEIGTEYAQTVPIIALTANAIVGAEHMFLRHGFQAFVTKPVNLAHLDAVLKQLVWNEELEKEFCGQHNAAPAAGVPITARIDNLDLEECLRRFGGDNASLLQVLHSYAANTPALLEQMRAPAEENPSAYIIAAHGVKGSSYGICARNLGRMAEDLERAAATGNFEFVKTHNDDFLAATWKLLADLSAFLENLDRENQKPKKDAPDSETLRKLRAACAAYDMDGVDRAMIELENYVYERQPELTEWLRERVNTMEFQQIMDKLAYL
jgi:signal transduction histidine kinase/FixJ family two-component response regulator/HPt (histidine-containing phosphotransfer) domain-containing protein